MEKQKKIETQSYLLRSSTGGFLGQIVITSDGFFGSVTDYGNLSFKWTGFGDDFKKFISSINEECFGRKLLQGLYCVERTDSLIESIHHYSINILPALKKELEDEAKTVQGKRYFVRNNLQNNCKNKLDETIHEEFRKFLGRIVEEKDLDIFQEQHKQILSGYKQSGGRCKPIEYSDNRKWKNSHSTDTITVYVSETYWLDLMLIKE